MDMVEEEEDENRVMKQKTLRFKLIESGMFSAFDGTWMCKFHSRSRKFDSITGQYVTFYRTQLTYSVLVKPKGIVPVMALEWRIREDVPPNLKGIKSAAERLSISKQIFPYTEENSNNSNQKNDKENNSNNSNKNNMIANNSSKNDNDVIMLLKQQRDQRQKEQVQLSYYSPKYE